MLKLIIVATVVGAVVADLDSRWDIFKAIHNKRYSKEEDSIRKSIWISNHKYIQKHNNLYKQGESTFYLGENQFTDMTRSEVVASRNRVINNKRWEPVKYLSQRKDLPKTVDWRAKGYVTLPKDQGNCKSDWAFSATGAIEGQHFKSAGKLVSLSESNLVECSGKFGNDGCLRGNVGLAFQYVIANHGIDTEASYPYVPKVDKCKFSSNNIGANISDYRDVATGSESALQEAVAKIGPISVVINVDGMDFMQYKGGVYHGPDCDSLILNFAALVVGYGTENGKDYWLVKNSWGTKWGLDGYIKMSRNNNNNCCIASAASYPIV